MGAAAISWALDEVSLYVHMYVFACMYSFGDTIVGNSMKFAHMPTRITGDLFL